MSVTGRLSDSLHIEFGERTQRSPLANFWDEITGLKDENTSKFQLHAITTRNRLWNVTTGSTSRLVPLLLKVPWWAKITINSPRVFCGWALEVQTSIQKTLIDNEGLSSIRLDSASIARWYEERKWDLRISPLPRDHDRDPRERLALRRNDPNLPKRAWRLFLLPTWFLRILPPYLLNSDIQRSDSWINAIFIHSS